MACPYFYPVEEADLEDRPRPARAPLGSIFAGECRAQAEPFRPSGETLFDLCNFGNARGTCPRFPATAEADAVRFTEWKGTVLFVLERDASPLRHGRADEDLADPVLARQAAVFTRSSCLTR